MSENRKQAMRWIPVLEVLFFAFFTYYARGMLDSWLVSAQVSPLAATILRVLLLLVLISAGVGAHLLLMRVLPKQEK